MDEHCLLDQNQIAAIIGYWRSGAGISKIAFISDAEPAMVELIIENHQNRLTKIYERKNNRAIQQSAKRQSNIQSIDPDQNDASQRAGLD